MFKLCLHLVVGFVLTVASDRVWSDETGSFDEQVAAIVQQGIADGEMPGAVVMVANRNEVLYQRAFGDRQVEPQRTAMTIDTVFDLASLTKPIATATSVMRLVQSGKVQVDQPVSNYLPEFKGHGKESITVSDLLLHVGGLTPDNALSDYQQGTEEAWNRICGLKMIAGRREKFAYSDVGFIVLGKLVERVSGKTLDRFVLEEIFQPLGMQETTYLPGDALRQRAAPTEQRDGHWMQGEVHDPRAYLLGGVAGHAGLFSTAEDLVRYGQMMLAQGQAAPQVLDANTFALMTQPRDVPSGSKKSGAQTSGAQTSGAQQSGNQTSGNQTRGTRTFGWDHRSPYSSNRGESLSDSAFGHGGFTGTVIWIDPEKDRVFVFLSNRLHPDGKGTVNRLAGEIATLIGNESGS